MDNLKRLESEKKQIDRVAEEEKARCETLAAELGGRSFSISMKATEDGHLYGSVDAAAVAGLLRVENIEVAEKDVRLEEPLKELGIYEVDIQIHPEVMAKTKVWVVSEENPEEPATGVEESPETPETE
jgi:large subunit ribosomal protein L9